MGEAKNSFICLIKVESLRRKNVGHRKRLAPVSKNLSQISEDPRLRLNRVDGKTGIRGHLRSVFGAKPAESDSQSVKYHHCHRPARLSQPSLHSRKLPHEPGLITILSIAARICPNIDCYR